MPSRPVPKGGGGQQPSGTAGTEGGAVAGRALPVARSQVVSKVTELAPAEAATPCQADGDCVRVAADCCGFGGGGVCGAALQTKVKQLQQRRLAQCRDQICLAVTSSDPSCLGPLSCQQQRCVVLAPSLPTAGGIQIKSITPRQPVP